jgi:hypothetical protein
MIEQAKGFFHLAIYSYIKKVGMPRNIELDFLDFVRTKIKNKP